MSYMHFWAGGFSEPFNSSEEMCVSFSRAVHGMDTHQQGPFLIPITNYFQHIQISAAKNFLPLMLFVLSYLLESFLELIYFPVLAMPSIFY